MTALLLTVLALVFAVLAWLLVRRWRARLTIDTARTEWLDAYAANVGLIRRNVDRPDEETDAELRARIIETLRGGR